MALFCNENLSRIGSGQGWWEFQYQGKAESIKQAKGLMFFIVSDKYSSLTSGFSIITIYTSVILLIASVIRSMFSGQVWMLEFTEMVQPDDLLLICEAISIARS